MQYVSLFNLVEVFLCPLLSNCWVGLWYFWHRTCLSIVWNHTPFPPAAQSWHTMTIVVVKHINSWVWLWCHRITGHWFKSSCSDVAWWVFFMLLTKGKRKMFRSFYFNINAEGKVISGRDDSYYVNKFCLLFSSFYFIIANMKTWLFRPAHSAIVQWLTLSIASVL